MSPQGDLMRLFAASFREVWTWLAALGVGRSELREAALDVFLAARRVLDGAEGGEVSRPWLFTIATEVARVHRARGGAAEASNDSEHPPSAPMALDRLLGPLTEAERVTFLLFELGGLSCAQIAELTLAPPALVLARLRSARDCVESNTARLASPCP